MSAWIGAEEADALLVSLRVSAAATAISAPVGTALGVLLARGRFRGKLALDVLVHLPLVLTPVVVGYLLLLAFGRGGLLGLGLAFTPAAAVIACAVIGLPLVVRSVRAAVEMVDPELEEAALLLGASRERVLRTVTLPLAAPGVIGGALLGFARSLGEFGATITFAGNLRGETRTLPAAIHTATQEPGGDGVALRLTLLSILLSVLALAGAELLQRRLRARGERP